MITNRILHSRSGFTLVELIVGMTIFSVGMTAILALLHSTIDTAIASRQEIIASNLLREQIELIKNVRNSNVRSFVRWDAVLLDPNTPGFLSAGEYIIENDYTTPTIDHDPTSGDILSVPVYMKKLSGFPPSSDLEGRFTQTALKIDNQGRYNHRSGSGTSYASYVLISPLIVQKGGVNIVPELDGKNQGFIIDARVIARSKKGYREYDLKTVITDWKK